MRAAGEAVLDHDLRECLDQQGVSPAEFAVMNAVFSQPFPKPKLIRQVLWLTEHNPFLSHTEAEFSAAIEKLIHRSLLQVLSADCLRTIEEDLRRSPAFGPIVGLPAQAGSIDFTYSGQSLFTPIHSRILKRGEHEFDVSFLKSDEGDVWEYLIYATSIPLALSTHERHMRTLNRVAYDRRSKAWYRLSTDVITSSTPEPIGFWRDHWWRSPAEGFRLRVTYRRNKALWPAPHLDE